MEQRRRVDIGGVQLEAVVAGNGPVTVVFENGLATSLEEWETVAAAIARRTRTVRYDRRRAAPSGDVPPRTASELARDLRTLLGALAVSPPYVLVGHSWGGVDRQDLSRTHTPPKSPVSCWWTPRTKPSTRGAFALLPLMYVLMGIAARFAGGRRWLMKTLCPPGAPASYRARLEQRMSDPPLWRISLRTAEVRGHGHPASLAAVARDCPDLPAIPSTS
jgi:pimeloyl-ACP methyl ester carboxylesterase